MINGLYIQMATEKLRAHLFSRIDEHGRKARWYGEQADNLSDKIEETADLGKMTNQSPVASLRQSQKSHADRASFFALLADNLIPDELYRLSQEDCILLDLRAQYLR